MADDNRLELTRAAHEAMQPDRKSPLEGAMDFLASIAKITQGEAAGLAKPDAEADPPPKATAALLPTADGPRPPTMKQPRSMRAAAATTAHAPAPRPIPVAPTDPPPKTRAPDAVTACARLGAQ